MSAAAHDRSEPELWRAALEFLRRHPSASEPRGRVALHADLVMLARLSLALNRTREVALAA
jgi:hypothetical protein